MRVKKGIIEPEQPRFCIKSVIWSNCNRLFAIGTTRRKEGGQSSIGLFELGALPPLLHPCHSPIEEGFLSFNWPYIPPLPFYPFLTVSSVQVIKYASRACSTERLRVNQLKLFVLSLPFEQSSAGVIPISQDS